MNHGAVTTSSKTEETSRPKTAEKRRQIGVIQLVGMGLAAAAVVKELRRPADERVWNGVVAGFVPYDFRFPTVERFRERLWNPDSPRLLSPRVFGVGWSLNVGRVVGLIREGFNER